MISMPLGKEDFSCSLARVEEGIVREYEQFLGLCLSDDPDMQKARQLYETLKGRLDSSEGWVTRAVNWIGWWQGETEAVRLSRSVEDLWSTLYASCWSRCEQKISRLSDSGAITILRSMREVFPNEFLVLRHLGERCLKIRLFDESRECFEQAFSLIPDSEVGKKLEALYRKNGEDQKAREVAARLLCMPSGKEIQTLVIGGKWIEALAEAGEATKDSLTRIAEIYVAFAGCSSISVFLQVFGELADELSAQEGGLNAILDTVDYVCRRSSEADDLLKWLFKNGVCTEEVIEGFLAKLTGWYTEIGGRLAALEQRRDRLITLLSARGFNSFEEKQEAAAEMARIRESLAGRFYEGDLSVGIIPYLERYGRFLQAHSIPYSDSQCAARAKQLLSSVVIDSEGSLARLMQWRSSQFLAREGERDGVRSSQDA